MRTTIDKGGRIVVPKEIRDAMGLTPGRKVDIVFADGRIEIEAAPAELELRTVDGLPVIQALDEIPPMEPGTVRQTIETVRGERDARHV